MYAFLMKGDTGMAILGIFWLEFICCQSQYNAHQTGNSNW